MQNRRGMLTLGLQPPHEILHYPGGVNQVTSIQCPTAENEPVRLPYR